MLKAIESELFRVSISDNHLEYAYIIEAMETSSSICIYKDELDELIMLLNKAKNIL